MPTAHKWPDNCYGVFQGLHNQHYSQMSSVAALPMPLQGENHNISNDHYSLHFKSSHCRAPQQRQGQICTLVVWGENICQKAVNISPMQSAGDLLHNVPNTNDTINFSEALKKSVQYHVWEELQGILAYLLDKVEINDTLGKSPEWQNLVQENSRLSCLWNFLCTITMEYHSCGGVAYLWCLCWIPSRVSQSSRAKSIPSNALPIVTLWPEFWSFRPLFHHSVSGAELIADTWTAPYST